MSRSSCASLAALGMFVALAAILRPPTLVDLFRSWSERASTERPSLPWSPELRALPPAP